LEQILRILGISLGTALAAWGMFHQLIVGGAAMVAKHHHPDEKEARLFVMAWVAQGGFMTFLGLIPATMLFLYGPLAPAVHTVLAISALALILLSLHVFLTGFGTHIRPIQIGAVLEALYGLLLVVIVSFT